MPAARGRPQTLLVQPQHTGMTAVEVPIDTPGNGVRQVSDQEAVLIGFGGGNVTMGRGALPVAPPVGNWQPISAPMSVQQTVRRGNLLVGEDRDKSDNPPQYIDGKRIPNEAEMASY